ncbi:GntR family transcriptional regulator [Aestuariibius sp. HNIBRBA575]|uniref:GntR family transcriptional regulator n=1 Tax=Aestuariibius sp. HNIBRBA575 TaxID=3233343 RepID=UPI0034A4DEC0
MPSDHAHPRPEFARDVSLSDLLRGITLNGDISVANQVYNHLRNLIVTLKIYPGQLISEKEVAQIFSASKTPVREAIIRLEEVELVNIVPKSGTYVAPLNVNRYAAACFTRLHLEIGGVRAAAKHKNRRDFRDIFADIMAQQERCVAQKNHEGFFHLDELLHKTIFEVAGVPHVWDVIHRTQADVHRVRHLRRIHNKRNEAKVIADRPDLLAFIETLNTTRSRQKRGKSPNGGVHQGMEETCQA